MELFIVRHGQTVWNAEGKLQGNSDTELNEQGREAAVALGKKLAETEFDCIYSSPLKRAYETACLIRGGRPIPIVRDDRLREISFGVMEGAHYSEMMDEACESRHFFEEPGRYVPPKGGETLEEVIRRTGDFLEEMLKRDYPQKKRVMIVAHGALNKGLMCHLEGNGPSNYWGRGLQKNCEAEIFAYDGTRWQNLTPRE